jgi:hypothetical protein
LGEGRCFAHQFFTRSAVIVSFGPTMRLTAWPSSNCEQARRIASLWPLSVARPAAEPHGCPASRPGRWRTKALTHNHPNSQPTQVVIDASPSGVTKERSQSSWRPLQAKRVQTIAQTTAPTPKRPNRATRAASMFHPRISCGRLQEHSVNAAKSSRDEVSLDDIRVLPLLRSAAVVKGLRFPHKSGTILKL